MAEIQPFPVLRENIVKYSGIITPDSLGAILGLYTRVFLNQVRSEGSARNGVLHTHDLANRLEQVNHLLASALRSAGVESCDKPMPSLEEVMADLETLPKPPRHLTLATRYLQGIELFYSDTLLLESLLGSDDVSMPVQLWLNIQPRFKTPINDNSEAVSLHDTETRHKDLSHKISLSLTPSSDRVRNIKDMFVALAQWAQALLTVSKLSSDEYDEGMKVAAKWLEMRITDPFSGLCVDVRKQLLHIVLQHAHQSILKDIHDVRSNHPHNEWTWWTHKHMVAHFRMVMYGKDSAISEALEALDWSAYMGDQVPENVHYEARYEPPGVHNPLHDIERRGRLPWDDEEEEEPEEEWQVFEPIAIEDVHWEPNEPPLSVTECFEVIGSAIVEADEVCTICYDGFREKDPEYAASTLVRNPMMVRCGHVFHSGCLQEHINGIMTYSIQCPQCRHIICRPRAKRFIVSESGNSNEQTCQQSSGLQALD
ncbi:hypothetical protein CC80DRAFT_554313 [Byssothecium circinans]|uniref:RING-type domain-containing protein n=1 Tax=Byssothecium circinans TaxID=147558 RepID=A0A6A5TFL1_9PLEO|nr:hypothetical protein CC80DRAFT_554313 [Byssothecium circinans]